MSKYYKADDVVRKRAEDLADTSYWEWGNPKNVDDWIEVAEMEFKDLPTIDIIECDECRWRDVCSQVVSDIGCEIDTMLRWCSDGERSR